MRLPRELWLIILEEKSRLERRERIEIAKKVLDVHLFELMEGTGKFKVFCIEEIAHNYNYFYKTPSWDIKVLLHSLPRIHFGIHRRYIVNDKEVMIRTEIFKEVDGEIVHSYLGYLE